MDILLDTHILLWFVKGDSRLSKSQLSTLNDLDNNIVVSMASLWEIAIKTGLKKLTIPSPLDVLVPKRIGVLNFTVAQLLTVQNLPHHHGDPFDRIIIAQALAEDIHVMSVDPNFPLYGVKLI